MKSSILFVWLLLFAAASASAQVYEVKLDKAEIRSSPKSTAFGSLIKGTKLEYKFII